MSDVLQVVEVILAEASVDEVCDVSDGQPDYSSWVKHTILSEHGDGRLVEDILKMLKDQSKLKNVSIRDTLALLNRSCADASEECNRTGEESGLHLD